MDPEGLSTNTKGISIFGTVYVAMLVWIGWPWTGPVPPPTFGDYGSWLGAIASFFTGVVALWIAGRADRRLVRESRVRARLTALRIFHNVGHGLYELRGAKRLINDDLAKGDYRPAMYSVGVQQVSGLLDPITPLDLEHLAALPNQAAESIAAAKSSCAILIADLGQAATQAIPDDRNSRVETLHRWMQDFQRAERFLDDARRGILTGTPRKNAM